MADVSAVKVRIERGHAGRLPANLIALRDQVQTWLAGFGCEGEVTLRVSPKDCTKAEAGTTALLSSSMSETGTVTIRVSTSEETKQCEIDLPGKANIQKDVFERMKGGKAGPYSEAAAAKAEPSPPKKVILAVVKSVTESPSVKQKRELAKVRPEADIILSRTHQGNRETKVVTRADGADLVMLIRRCADERPNLVRILPSGSENPLDYKHVKPAEAIALAIDDILDAGKHLGEFQVKVASNSGKPRGNLKHPAYISALNPTCAALLIRRGNNDFAVCAVTADTAKGTTNLRESLLGQLPRITLDTIEKDVTPLPEKSSGPTDINQLKQELLNLLEGQLIRPPRIDVLNTQPEEIPTSPIELDGPIRFVIPVRAKLSDGSSRKVLISTDDFETACRIRFIIGDLGADKNP